MVRSFGKHSAQRLLIRTGRTGYRLAADDQSSALFQVPSRLTFSGKTGRSVAEARWTTRSRQVCISAPGGRFLRSVELDPGRVQCHLRSDTLRRHCRVGSHADGHKPVELEAEDHSFEVGAEWASSPSKPERDPKPASRAYPPRLDGRDSDYECNASAAALLRQPGLRRALYVWPGGPFSSAALRTDRGLPIRSTAPNPALFT